MAEKKGGAAATSTTARAPERKLARVDSDTYTHRGTPIGRGTLVSLPASILEAAQQIQPPELKPVDKAEPGEVLVDLFPDALAEGTAELAVEPAPAAADAGAK